MSRPAFAPQTLLLSPLLLVGLMACTSLVTVPLDSVDCGPRPGLEDAKAYVQLVADRTLWGPQTSIVGVQVGGKARWHNNMTGQWPGGASSGPTLEGWLITFAAKPKAVLNPYPAYQELEVLLDKDRVVHWRTNRTWDKGVDALPKPYRVRTVEPPAQPAPKGS